WKRRESAMVRILAWAVFAVFMITAFRAGWTRSETDFPGYYTAAVLVRKHLPLRNYYEWEWFQRQMNYAGIETQLGAYAAQTPLAMMPLVAFASLPVQTAKRIWLTVNLGLLIGTIWLLSRLTSFSPERIAILAFCGFDSLARNFVLGQYYVCLLFLLTAAFYFLCSQRNTAAGVMAGVAFGLKLYGGPFLVYFAVKRNWRAVGGMLIAMLCLIAIALGIFGSTDVHYYATQILPRAMEGSPIDPYHPGSPTLSAFLRRTLEPEPWLNPHPLFDAAWLF